MDAILCREHGFVDRAVELLSFACPFVISKITYSRAKQEVKEI